MLSKLFNLTANKLEWHQLYYLLAIINIITILAALSLTQLLMDSYEHSVEENRKMSVNVSEFIKLGYIAQSVNEPGNRIFNTKDVASETNALQQNKLWFDTAFQHAKNSINDSFTAEQLNVISSHLVILQKNMELMANESLLIFQAVKQDELVKAGRHMSAMDAYYYQVTQAIGEASQYIADIQNEHFVQQIAKAKEIKRYEIAISLVVIIIITLVTVYGHKLGNRLKSNAEVIAKALSDAQQSAKAKEMFLANMSHEIRTPMNAILGMLKLIDSQELSIDNKQYLKLASSSADNLLVIINDILNLAKSENNQLVLEQLPFDICQLINNQAALYRLTHKDKDINLTCDISRISTKRLKGDYNRLTQVINNLLNNAFKFTKQGEIAINAKTENVQKKVSLTISVQDTGIGIAENKLATIFEAFTQADASTTRKYGGTGLGLAISKKICQLMQGDLTVTSQIGQGSCFTIEVLLSEDEAPSASGLKQHRYLNEENNTFTPLNLHLLVAEDNRVNQILLKKLLDNMGCSYDIANNGQQALELLNEQHQAILMDCLMPELDGYQATKKIRALSTPLSQIPIIAVTANSMPDDQQKCLDAGMNSYVAKPIEFNTLYQQLAHIAKQNNSTKE